MSAVQHALELPKQWAEEHAIQSSPLSRWGPAIWPAEEPVERLQRPERQVIPSEILAIALLQSSRS